VCYVNKYFGRRLQTYLQSCSLQRPSITETVCLQPSLDFQEFQSPKKISELVYHFTLSLEWDLKDVADGSFLALEAQQYAVSLQ